MNLRGAARAEASEKFLQGMEGSQREGRDLNLRAWPEGLTWSDENLGWGVTGASTGWGRVRCKEWGGAEPGSLPGGDWAGPQVGVVKSQEAEPTWRLEGTQLRDWVA